MRGILIALGLLLLAASLTVAGQVGDFCRADRRVRLWIELFNGGGIDALITRPRPGRPRKVKRERVRDTLAGDPKVELWIGAESGVEGDLIRAAGQAAHRPLTWATTSGRTSSAPWPPPAARVRSWWSRQTIRNNFSACGCRPHNTIQRASTGKVLL